MSRSNAAQALKHVSTVAVAFLLSCSPSPSDNPANEADSVSSPPVGSDTYANQTEGLSIKSVAPNRGPVGGGGQMDIAGSGFVDGMRVWIGNSEVKIAWRAGNTHLFVPIPPATSPGIVDIKLQVGKDKIVGIPRAYTYVDVVTVDDFVPKLGSSAGGGEITVHGSGFVVGDRVLVGYMETMSSEVVDSTTIVAVTPPWPEMNADTTKVIVSVRHASGITHSKDFFTYGRVPTLDSVEPTLVPVGGAAATLHGGGLGVATDLYANGVKGQLAAGTATSVRGATLPALKALDPTAQPGVADLLVVSPFGAAKLAPAFAYFDDQSKVPVLYGVVPKSGPTSGGTSAVLLASVPQGSKVTGVTWGDKPATFTNTAGKLTVQVPPADVGPIAVTVKTDAGDATLQNAYTYLQPIELSKLNPDSGPTAGGTKAVLVGSGFVPGCVVHVGIYTAQITGIAKDGTTIDLVTPPGPGGTAAVTVACNGSIATIVNGFAYTDGPPHINVVDPGTGATGGDTPVKIHGSGFKKGMMFYFDGKPATAITIVNSGLAELSTPAHEPGLVAVDVVYGKDHDTLIDGFSYYSPASPTGGTWGEETGGTLNVTVLNIYTLAPITDAFVILGQPGEAIFEKYQGVTDDLGQIVFHGADLVAPITVSASKQEFSASSIVSFDARNATLLLWPWTPPSSGKGDPKNKQTLPLATLQGKVMDLDKYLPMPPTNCLKTGDLGDKTCDACSGDQDCSGKSANNNTFQCVDNGAAGKRCLANCATDNDCSKGFACFAESSLPGQKFCKPTQGIRKVFCSTSLRDRDTPNPQPCKAPKLPKDAECTLTSDADSILPYDAVGVDELTGQYSLTSRLDELAVACVAGYIDNQTKKFIPVSMGLRRHVFPISAGIVKGLDIKLDIPLKRTLNVRLDHPQHAFPVGHAGDLKIDPWIALGSDGLVVLSPLRSPPTLQGASTVKDDVELPYQPINLPDDLTDATYLYFARVEFQPAGGNTVTPITATLHDNVKAPGDANVRVRAIDGKLNDASIGTDLEMTGIVRGDKDQLLLLARNGRLYRGSVEAPTLIYAPPVFDPYAVPALVLALAGTPTDATMVGEAGLIRRLQGSQVQQESGVFSQTLRDVCTGPLGRVAVGDAGAFEYALATGAQAGVWQALSNGSKLGWHAVVCTEFGAVAVGDKGGVATLLLSGSTPQFQVENVTTANLYAITADQNGDLWLAGDVESGANAPILKKLVDSKWVNGWTNVNFANAVPGLRGLVGLPNTALLLLDRDGGQHRLDATGLANESPQRLDLRASRGVALADGSSVLVGQPGLWLGPFLTVPQIDKPTSSNAANMPLEWSVAPGPSPSYSRVHLDGSGFPFWWLYVEPTVTSAVLPNFSALGGFDVFPASSKIQYSVRVDRVYVPSGSINGFDTFTLEFGEWRSWSTNAKPFIP